MWVWECEFGYSWRAENDTGKPVAGDTGCCELPDVGSGNYTQVVSSSSLCS